MVEFTLEDSISAMADKAIAHISRQSGAAIVGFSMGGMVAMEIARKAPELIKKLALLNTNYHADYADRRAARIQHLEQALSTGMEDVIRQHYVDRYLHHPKSSARNLIIKMACELGTACFEAQIKALTTRPDSSSTLADISCPTLILSAAQDKLCPPEGQGSMHQMIEGSEIVMLDECGHFAMLENPDAVNMALQKWYGSMAVSIDCYS